MLGLRGPSRSQATRMFATSARTSASTTARSSVPSPWGPLMTPWWGDGFGHRANPRTKANKVTRFVTKKVDFLSYSWTSSIFTRSLCLGKLRFKRIMTPRLHKRKSTHCQKMSEVPMRGCNQCERKVVHCCSEAMIITEEKRAGVWIGVASR